ncbi:MAG TPA: O-antigen ligase family protein [Candidatus Binataceae bacterium]|nr:O-antigen ligase family protein [Candidatus Binataceae bacterium]
MAGADATFLSVPAQRQTSPHGARLIVGTIVALVVVALLYSLQAGSTYLLLAACGLTGMVGVCYALPYVARHRDWLACAIVLIFLFNAFFFLNPTARVIFHYGALALFCLPVAATALRANILRRGGFRLYLAYFTWAAVTISYSLAPEYSLARLGEAVLILAVLAAVILEAHAGEDAVGLLKHFLVGAGAVLALLAVSALLLPHDLTWVSPLQSFSLDELSEMQKQGISVAGVDRFRGLLNGPNDVGGLMLIIVGPAIVCWQTAGRRTRATLAALIVFALLLAGLADSRSPFVALAVGGALYIVWRWRARGVLLLSAAAAGLLLFYTHGDLGAYVGRGDVSTLTGRTDIWAFTVRSIEQRPILGYGYEVSGAIFLSRYFPIWWGPWDLGPHSSLHNGYLDHAVGVGIPATLLWLYIILRPWVFVLRQPGDPWRLKSIFLLIVVPILVNNMTEAFLGDLTDSVGFLFGIVWALAERYRLLATDEAQSTRAEAIASLPRAAMALAWGR